MCKSIFLSICLLIGSVLSAGDPIIYLTWQKDPTSTMTIQWITKDEAADDVVTYKLDKEEAKDWLTEKGSRRTFAGDTAYQIHVVELTKLQPNSSYRFTLASDKKEFLFRTMPSDIKTPICFVVGGDTSGEGMDAFTKTNIEAAKEEPYFTLFGGDLAYSVRGKINTKENHTKWIEWLDIYYKTMVTPKGYLIPLIVAIGNHEVNGFYDQSPEIATSFYTLFAMPGIPGYNVLRFKSYLSIYLLDSGHTNPIAGKQTAWLKTELQKDTNVTHKVALYHVPAYPSVRYFRRPISSALRRHWVPLFDQYGLHVAFENHEHAYKRTFPLTNGSVTPKGVVYIGDGAWGVDARAPKKPYRTTYLAKSKKERHYIKVELSETERAYFAIKPGVKTFDEYIQQVK